MLAKTTNSQAKQASKNNGLCVSCRTKKCWMEIDNIVKD
jgi:hypothetical protein